MRQFRGRVSLFIFGLGVLVSCALLWPEASRSELGAPAIETPRIRVMPPDPRYADPLWREILSPREAVGYSDLLAELGGVPDGSGSRVNQVESGSPAYMPDPTYPAFAGKTFVDGSGFNSGSFGHATLVGQRQYGSEVSLSPGVADITVYEAYDWITRVLGFGSGSAPLPQPFAVMNHSYVGVAIDAADAQEFSRRMDAVVEQENAVVVVATNNGASNPLPDLFAQTYNTITVGSSNGGHASGLTTVNGAGRVKPDIVAPESETSYATPMVTAAASMLLDQGQATGNPHAMEHEVVKAVLLAGATKAEFPGWSNSDVRPLDLVYGAGELNVYNSYFIMAGGEFANSDSGGPAPLAGDRGWDYEPQIVPLQARDYRLQVNSTAEISIALTWDARVFDTGGAFDYDSLELPTLELYLQDSSGSFPGPPVAVSKSPVDNVQHIHLQEVPAGTYTITVRSIDGTTDYALAWRVEEQVVLPLNADYIDAVLASGPVLYWSFEEAALDSAQDRITQLANNALVPQQGATRAESMPGLGSAASFNGTHDHAQTQPRFYADALSLGGPTVLDHYAIEMWVKLNDASGIQYLLEATSPSSTNVPAVIHGFSTDAGVPALEYFGAGARTGEAGPTVLTDNQWHHLVMEADVASNTHTIYVDGQLAIQAPGAVAWQLPTLGVGATAYWDGLHGVDGLIDELAFYDLSSGPTTGARIASHFYVMFAATDAPPVASPTARPVLYASVPNPFNPSTTIRFDLPRAGRVELAIYDVAGRRVRTLVQESMGAGSHQVIWRGVDDNGQQVASGVYLYRLEAGAYVETRRMTLIK